MHEPPRPAFRSTFRHSRGYIPHDDRRHVPQLVTFRLHSAIDFSKSKCLRLEPCARAVEQALLRLTPRLDSIVTWVVMPDHVHAIVVNGSEPLSKVVESWKKSAALAINREMKTAGRVWAREYHDRRLVRDGALASATAYVEANPVRAGLCAHALAWRFSGIHRRLGLTP